MASKESRGQKKNFNDIVKELECLHKELAGIQEALDALTPEDKKFLDDVISATVRQFRFFLDRHWPVKK